MFWLVCGQVDILFVVKLPLHRIAESSRATIDATDQELNPETLPERPLGVFNKPEFAELVVADVVVDSGL